MVTASLPLGLVALIVTTAIRLSFPAQSTSTVMALTKTVVVLTVLTLMATAMLPSVGGPDCDDSNPPSALDDVGDDIDQNCDGIDGVDADQDGYASIESLGSDCDDLEVMNTSSGDSVGDGVDNNCDGVDGVDSKTKMAILVVVRLSEGSDCDDVSRVYPGDGIGDFVPIV